MAEDKLKIFGLGKFMTVEDVGKSHVVRTKRTQEILGVIDYYKPWKCFVFQPDDSDCIFNASCLGDIKEFLEKLDSQK